jgi:hypothetical protein
MQEDFMTTFDMESLIAIIAWLGGACFCGILPLGFALILFFTARKRGQVGSAIAVAHESTTAGLQPGAGLVRLRGIIAPHTDPVNGPPENAIVYMRLKVEVYDGGDDGAGWRGFTDKTRSVPFQLNDSFDSVWVNPDGLDRQLLGDGFVPDEHQVQSACVLLGIDPRILRGRLRFRMWEFRSGQTVTVIGNVTQAPQGVTVAHVLGQPFVVSPLAWDAIGSAVSFQTKKASTWTWILGGFGGFFLLCGLGGAVVSLVRLLSGG